MNGRGQRKRAGLDFEEAVGIEVQHQTNTG